MESSIYSEFNTVNLCAAQFIFVYAANLCTHSILISSLAFLKMLIISRRGFSYLGFKMNNKAQH